MSFHLMLQQIYMYSFPLSFQVSFGNQNVTVAHYWLLLITPICFSAIYGLTNKPPFIVVNSFWLCSCQNHHYYISTCVLSCDCSLPMFFFEWMLLLLVSWTWGNRIKNLGRIYLSFIVFTLRSLNWKCRVLWTGAWVTVSYNAVRQLSNYYVIP